MRSTRKWRFTCILLLSTCWVKAAEWKTVIAHADSLYRAGSYALAYLEYERAFFYGKDDRERALSLLKKGRALKEQGDCKEALTSLQRAPITLQDDTLQYQLYHERMLCAYLCSEYGEAEMQMQHMEFYVKDTSLTNGSIFLCALVHSEQGNWMATEKCLRKYFEHKGIRTDTMNLSWIYPRGLRSEKAAKFLSLFLPGSGQLYSGYPGRALTSLLLQGAAAAFAVISITQGFYLQGIFTGGGLFLRFYPGGARYAGKLAEKHNEKKRNQVREKVKQVISFYERN